MRSLRRLVLAWAVALACAPPGALALFGLRGKGSNPPAAAPAAAESGPAVPAAESSASTAPAAARTPKAPPAKSAEPNDPYPFPSNLEDLQDYEAWEDEAGEMHIIRAQRLPSGDFTFPEGTVVSAPPTPCNSPVRCRRVCGTVICRK